MEHLKARFLKVYANLPLNAREQVILKYNEQPITWNVAYFEVSSDSDNAESILEELSRLEFI